ncbi:MAG TPA: GGDEF domain-containing protein [Polyangia bacterium]
MSLRDPRLFTSAGPTGQVADASASAPEPGLSLSPPAATVPGRRSGGVVALIVEGTGRSGHVLEAQLGDAGVRVERTSDLPTAPGLATAAAATAMIYLPPAGPDRLAGLTFLQRDPATAGLPIVVMDEMGGPEQAHAAYAAGADEHWPGFPDLRTARIRLTALSRGVIAERQRDEALRELAQVRARLSEATGRLAREQETDEVTGLPNRKRLLQQLDVEWRRARRNGSPLSLVLLEIDRPAGGQGLVEEARLIAVSAALRAVLRRGGDLLARFSDNQVAASLPEVGPDGAAAVAQALRSAALRCEPTLFFTMGIVTARPQESASNSADSLVAEAEASLRRVTRSS